MKYQPIFSQGSIQEIKSEVVSLVPSASHRNFSLVKSRVIGSLSLAGRTWRTQSSLSVPPKHELKEQNMKLSKKIESCSWVF